MTRIRLVLTLPMLAMTAGATAQDAVDRAAGHTRLIVIQPEKGSEAQPIVALANPTATADPEMLKDTIGGILVRELYRQALLIAARDEMGLPTRDELLGDARVVAVAGAPQAEVSTVLRPGDSVSKAIIRRADTPSAEVLLAHDVPATGQPFGRLPRLVEDAEVLSRTGFPAVLRKLGLNGRPNPTRDDAGLPVGVEEQLWRLGYTEPFAAVRALHEVIRTGGESPARLAGLVRGYTSLGLLTEHHWHPAHKAFKARALLYAQRMVAHDPKGYSGLWHRAFAEALVGLPTEALADIAEARKRGKAAGDHVPPAWADRVEAYVRCDFMRMTIPEGPLAPFSALLPLLALEPTMLTELGLIAGNDVMALDPECYRAHDAMCRLGEHANNLDQPTEIGPDIFARTIPQRLGAMETLPAIVRAHLDNPSVTGSALFEALAVAGAPGADAGEPSWAVLGRLLRETRFVQVYRRLDLRGGPLGVVAGQYLKHERGAVADHPYFPYLESLASPRDQAPRALDGLIGHLDVTNVQLRSFAMLRAIEQSGHPAARAPWTLALKHVDKTVSDLSELVRSTTGRDQSDNALALLELNPDSDYARAVLIEKDWERARPRLVEWEKAANRSPVLLAALARSYSERGQIDDSRRFLLQYIKFSKDQWAYELLAKGFKDAGDVERWQLALDEFLAEAKGNPRSQTNVRVQMAEHFMGLGEWDKAWPYAEAAAGTGIYRALVCAARCAEGRKNWDAAEAYNRQITESNPGGGWAAWYLFCKRTGQGDAEAAGDFADRVLAKGGEGASATSPTAIGYFYWLRGDPKKAEQYFRKAYDSAPSATTCTPLILVADERGDTTTRDEWVRTLINRHRNQAPNTARIFEILATAAGPDKPGATDLQAVDKMLGKIRIGANRGNNEFFVGCYLNNHGNAAEARRHLELTLKSSSSNRFMRAIAADRLQHLGVDIRAIGAGPGTEEPKAKR